MSEPRAPLLKGKCHVRGSILLLDTFLQCLSHLIFIFVIWHPLRELLALSLLNVPRAPQLMQAFRNLSVQRTKLAKPCSGLYNPPIHQSEWPNKAGPVLL